MSQFCQTPAFLFPCACSNAPVTAHASNSQRKTSVKVHRTGVSPAKRQRQNRTGRKSNSTHRTRRTAQFPYDGVLTDAELFQRASNATKLSKARKTLRKQLGTEPTINSAVTFAAGSDDSLTVDMDEWKKVFDARNEVTVKWLWLVAAVARKAYRTYVEAFPEASAILSFGDISQEGVCGLMTAVERWDPSRDYAFDAFAFYSVKHAILRAIEKQSRPIRLPVHVLNKLSKMRKVRQQLTNEDNEPSIEQMAHLAGVDEREAKLYVERSKAMGSLDAPLRTSKTDSTQPTLREFLVDHSVDVARQVESACTREAVAELVECCNLLELERSVVLLKYGLNDGIERVRAEVSRILDVRVEKVRRAELSALKKLRETAGEDISDWVEIMS